jgi:hypothetical protein
MSFVIITVHIDKLSTELGMLYKNIRKATTVRNAIVGTALLFGTIYILLNPSSMVTGQSAFYRLMRIILTQTPWLFYSIPILGLNFFLWGASIIIPALFFKRRV